MGVAVMVTLCGCREFTPIQGSELARPPSQRPEQVRVSLRDQTLVTLSSPMLFNHRIWGRVTGCEGPSCDALRRDRSVSLSDTRSITTMERNGSATAGGVIAGVVLGGLVVGAIIWGLSLPSW